MHRLVKQVYEQYPYYAINSRTAITEIPDDAARCDKYRGVVFRVIPGCSFL